MDSSRRSVGCDSGLAREATDSDRNFLGILNSSSRVCPIRPSTWPTTPSLIFCTVRRMPPSSRLSPDIRELGPPIDGSVVGPLGISHAEMTDEIWDYIFANGAFPTTSSIPLQKVNTLKSEFSYFYPMDIRSSGKDLIPNHLSFCIYVHSALFAEEHWPLSMRANGHLMLNGEKMSKSTGNSLTLKDSLEKFGADATRVTLADAGDSIEDANFEESTANAAILRLRTLLEWCEVRHSLPSVVDSSLTYREQETLQGKATLRIGAMDSLWDKIFINELNLAIETTYEAYNKSVIALSTLSIVAD